MDFNCSVNRAILLRHHPGVYFILDGVVLGGQSERPSPGERYIVPCMRLRATISSANVGQGAPHAGRPERLRELDQA